MRELKEMVFPTSLPYHLQEGSTPTFPQMWGDFRDRGIILNEWDLHSGSIFLPNYLFDPFD